MEGKRGGHRVRLRDLVYLVSFSSKEKTSVLIRRGNKNESSPIYSSFKVGSAPRITLTCKQHVLRNMRHSETSCSFHYFI